MPLLSATGVMSALPSRITRLNLIWRGFHTWQESHKHTGTIKSHFCLGVFFGNTMSPVLPKQRDALLMVCAEYKSDAAEPQLGPCWIPLQSCFFTFSL